MSGQRKKPAAASAAGDTKQPGAADAVVAPEPAPADAQLEARVAQLEAELAAAVDERDAANGDRDVARQELAAAHEAREAAERECAAAIAEVEALQGRAADLERATDRSEETLTLSPGGEIATEDCVMRAPDGINRWVAQGDRIPAGYRPLD